MASLDFSVQNAMMMIGQAEKTVRLLKKGNYSNKYLETIFHPIIWID